MGELYVTDRVAPWSFVRASIGSPFDMNYVTIERTLSWSSVMQRRRPLTLKSSVKMKSDGFFQCCFGGLALLACYHGCPVGLQANSFNLLVLFSDRQVVTGAASSSSSISLLSDLRVVFDELFCLY